MEGLSFKQPWDTQEVEAGAGADGRLLEAGDHPRSPGVCNYALEESRAVLAAGDLLLWGLSEPRCPQT